MANPVRAEKKYDERDIDWHEKNKLSFRICTSLQDDFSREKFSKFVLFCTLAPIHLQPVFVCLSLYFNNNNFLDTGCNIASAEMIRAPSHLATKVF